MSSQTKRVEFFKYHEAGNDFLIIDETKLFKPLTPNTRSILAKALCNRKGTVGADGVSFIINSGQKLYTLKVLGPDGSDNSAYIDGVRCSGRYLLDRTQPATQSVAISNLGGQQTISKRGELHPGVGAYHFCLPKSVTVNPPENFGSSIRGTETDYVVAGGPQIIVFTNRIDESELKLLGSLVNADDSKFPAGLPVTFAKLLSKEKMFISTFFRGDGGLLLSSASAAIACVAAAAERSLVSLDEWVDVHTKGGLTKCKIKRNDGGFSGEMLGTSTFVFEGTVEVGRNHTGKLMNGNLDLTEITNYGKYESEVHKHINTSEIFSD